MKNRILSRFGQSVWWQWIMPLCFVLPAYFNLFFYYIGQASTDTTIRRIGFLLGSVLFAAVIGVSLLILLQKRVLSRKVIGLSLAVVLFYCTCFAVRYLAFGTTDSFVYSALQWAILAVPPLLAALCGMRQGGVASFFRHLESLSFFALPAGLLYFARMVLFYTPAFEDRSLGVLHYMNVSSIFMPLLLAHMVQLVRGKALTLPLFKRTVRHPLIWRAILVTVYWVDIMATGTRGAYFAIFAFCILWVVVSFFFEKRHAFTALLLSSAMFALLVFNIFIYAPPGLYAVRRMNIFLDGLKKGELITTVSEDPRVRLYVDDLVAFPGGQQITNRDGESDFSAENLIDKNLQIGSRGTLYRLAWKEFLKSPVTGMLPNGYSVKYGIYPHNVVLDLLCETGLVGTLLFGSLILYALWQMLRSGLRNQNHRELLIFLMAYAVDALISGTVWNCPALMFALGCGFAAAPDYSDSEEGGADQLETQ